ncbi:MAG: NOP58 family protein [Candidatus Diapherotrites archaeon]|nr:NOP58 family protein [Candidatus Diapherotrites archaeon]
MNYKAVRENLLTEARRQLKKEFSSAENFVIRAVGFVKTLDEAFNLTAEQLIELYNIFFPELSVVESETEKIVQIIAAFGSKEGIKKKELEKIVSKEKAERIVEFAKSSIGAKENPKQREIIAKIAKHLVEIKKLRFALVEQIENETKKFAPNLTELCSGLLAAKLIAGAGSLEKLALMPASTIQILGAEKAFFKFKRFGGKPPKHGIIFQHPLVRNAKPKNRGKIARSLASKIAIAAREDFYGKDKKLGKKLREEIEERAKGLEARR